MYSEQPYVNPYINSIADTMARPAQARANAIRQAAAIQGRAQEQQGQIWGQTAAQIGQIAAAIPGQIQQQKIAGQEQQVRDAQIDQLKLQKDARTALAAAIKQFHGDNEKIAATVSAAGFPEQAASWLKINTDNAESLQKLTDIKAAYAKHQREALGDLAYSAKTPDDFASALGVLAASGEIDEATAHKLADELTSSPEAAEAMRAKYLPFSPRYVRQQDELNKPQKLGRDESIIIPGQLDELGQPKVVATGPTGPTPAQEETARHNKALEEAAKLTAGRLEAQQAETIRHNKAMEALGAKSEGLTPNASLDATLKLRDRFVRETQAAQLLKTQFEQMKSSMAAVKSGGAAAGSQGVLVTFQKILDPTSVVRESEYARSSSGLSLMNRIEGQWMKIQQGGAGVKPSELQTFVNLAEQWVKNQSAAATLTKEQIDNIATEYGLKPENITRELEAAAAEEWIRDKNGKLVKSTGGTP